jgi:iron complex outermembrane recepter protein
MARNQLLRQAVRLAHRDAARTWSAAGARRFGAIGLSVAAAAGLLAVPAVSVGADVPSTGGAELMEVVVTGSSIAQKVDTSPLPVMVLSEKDIAKTGFTSISDLVQNLPAMQGFVPASSSVNGGGVGVTTAALHSLPSKYTLVLLDGQRIAPFALGSIQGGGFGVNLDSIPVDAIERIEVLTDGASALYGADAVAGVVNFITKKNRTDGGAYYHAALPDQGQGGSWNAGITKGFGDLQADGYNLLFTLSHDVQNKLQASDRAVSRQGAYFAFSSGGVNYLYNARTSNTEPANITVGQAGIAYNPFYIANGNCGNGPLAAPLTSSGSTTCRFNYAATVQDIPGNTRDSGLIRGTFKTGDDSEVWAEILVSDFTLRAQYAPPAQPFGISPTRFPTLWNTYVVGNPLLAGYTVCTAAPCAPGTISTATAGYRGVSAGGRTDDYNTLARHIAVGFDAKAWDWLFKGSIVASHGKLTDTAAGGYMDFNQFSAAVASGAYDPIMGVGASAIQGSILHSKFSESNSDVTSMQFNAQHKVLDMGGGESILSVGAEYDLTKYKTDYSSLILSQSGFSTQPASSNYPIGGNYGQVPFEADRTNWGLFAEWLLPLRKDLTVTASARYDGYSKVHSDDVFSAVADPVTGLQQQLAPAELGNTFNDTTYKVSARWTPLSWMSFRGSYGTGFRAPALGDIAGSLTFYGSTAGTYACPFPGSPGCLPGSAQYDLLNGPNGQSGSAGLKPEKSTQYTFGVRFDPMLGVALALDYWNVKIKDQIESFGVAEQVAFNNPQQYASLFVNPYEDPAGFTTIALAEVPFNGGEANYAGIDWNFSYRNRINWGTFGADWTGTYMLTQNYTNGPGSPKLTDLGVFGPDQQVVFKTISQLRLSLQTSKWTNSLSVHYKSGYRDQAHSAGEGVIFLQKPDGSLGAATSFAGLQVGAFATADWQTVLNVRDNLGLTVGITNLTGKMPPLSLQSGGGGNQAGYDGRYYDPTGRVYYARVDLHF